MAGAPQVVEKYKTSIADNPKVEMIHVSQDFDNEGAQEWAADAEFPWLTVLPENYEASGMLKFYTEAAVPFYTMIDREGNEVARGPEAVFAKVDELKKAEKSK